jgi:hypothetical protein
MVTSRTDNTARSGRATNSIKAGVIIWHQNAASPSKSGLIDSLTAAVGTHWCTHQVRKLPAAPCCQAVSCKFVAQSEAPPVQPHHVHADYPSEHDAASARLSALLAAWPPGPTRSQLLICDCCAELREMSRKADAEKRGKEQATAAMDSIEKAAKEQFEKDQQAAKAQAGSWVWNESSGYYYNALHRYDAATAAAAAIITSAAVVNQVAAGSDLTGR